MITAIDKNTALVIIDLQKGVLKLSNPEQIQPVIENVNELIKAFRTASLPVVFVKVDPIGSPQSKARVEKSSLPSNSVLQGVAKMALSMTGFADLLPELDVKPDDIVITKHTWSAFCNTPLNEVLKKLNITGIVLTGVSTSIGVEGTARAASELGYNISFAIDAMTDKLPESHDHSIRNIFPRIGELGTTQEIINKLK